MKATVPKIQPGDRLYFAYGSNLSVDQKQERTGPIRSARRCRLPGYRLVFNKRGSSRSPVFTNIVRDAHDEVWGVAYLCSPSAFERMDKCEGVAGVHYEHLEVRVVGDDCKDFAATTDVASPGAIADEASPSEEYLQRILSGAGEHALPESYIRAVEQRARQAT